MLDANLSSQSRGNHRFSCSTNQPFFPARFSSRPVKFFSSPFPLPFPLYPVGRFSSDLCRLCRLGLFVMRLSANRLVCHLFAFRSPLQLLLPFVLRFVTFFVVVVVFVYLFLFVSNFICFCVVVCVCVVCVCAELLL